MESSKGSQVRGRFFSDIELTILVCAHTTRDNPPLHIAQREISRAINAPSLGVVAYVVAPKDVSSKVHTCTPYLKNSK